MKKNKSTKINLKNGILVDVKPVLPPVYLSTGHKIDFEIGQIVYLKTDSDQHGRIVTGINLRPNRGVAYCLSLGTSETGHYGIEIDDERDIIKAKTCL